MCVDGVEFKHWSRTQTARALSSGEAEYYAMVTGCAEGGGSGAAVVGGGLRLEGGGAALDRQQRSEGGGKSTRPRKVEGGMSS